MAYLNKIKRTKYDKLEKALRKLEKQQQKHEAKGLTNQIKELKKQIESILDDELEKKLRFTKQTFYESDPKATKISARRLRTQQIINSIHNIRDPLTNKITYEPEEIHKIINS